MCVGISTTADGDTHLVLPDAASSHAIWTRCSPGRCFRLAGTTNGEEGDADIMGLHTLAYIAQRAQGTRRRA